MDRKGRCFKGGHLLVDKTNRLRTNKQSMVISEDFAVKFGTSKDGAIGV